MSAMRYDVIDVTDGGAEIATAVSLRVAAELTGTTAKLIEDRIGRHGELGVTNFSQTEPSQELLVRVARAARAPT